jgi:hypothetical protein
MDVKNFSIAMVKRVVEYDLDEGYCLDLEGMYHNQELRREFEFLLDNETNFKALHLRMGEVKAQLFPNGKLLLHSKTSNHEETIGTIYRLGKLLEKFAKKKK